jgi:tetratricopeptide (TPR) repeat protein
VPDAELLERAQAALRLASVEPSVAANQAGEAYAAAVGRRLWDAASVADRALGLAAVHLHDLDLACTHLRNAVMLARRAGRADLAAEARMTLAFALNRQGRLRRALIEIDAAVSDLDGAGRARAIAQRGAILQQLGRLDEATAEYRSALPQLRRADDRAWIQRVLSNRGVLHAFRHEYRLALRDLNASQEICVQLGLTLPTAFVNENLALVHRRLGDVPRALLHLERAERIYASVDTPLGSLLLERGETLLSVRLFAEAREACQQAVAEFERANRRLSTPEARLLLARAAVLDEDAELAEAEARKAAGEFRRQARREYVTLARCHVLLARLEGAGSRAVTSRELAAAAAAAQACGWPDTALEMRLRAGLVALSRGARYRRTGLRELEVATAARRAGPAHRRAKGWYATALLRDHSGDRRGCAGAARTGLRIIDDYRDTMVATDLRAHVSGLGVELAALGLRTALTGGSPEAVLTWAELGRARHLQDRPALPPRDPLLAELLADLRTVVAQIEERQWDGKPAGRLAGRQLFLERAIRDAHRRLPSDGYAPSRDPRRDPPSPQELCAALGGAALVEYVESDGLLYAVSVADGRARLTPLGPRAAVADQVRWLPFALTRLSRHRTSGASAAAAVDLVRRTAATLGALLLQPLESLLAGRPVVVVPTGVLQSMPWSLLPQLRGYPVAVAPSAALWLAAAARAPQIGRVVVVAGPGLPGAHAEAVDIAGIYGDRPPLVGDASTAQAVSSAVDGAALVHLAAHGKVRADNPLFSSLQLADGPLTVYELERLDRGADTVVLASCDSGRDVVLAGDEMIGFSAAFLNRHTRNVVASVVPIPDAATAPIMVAFHRNMVAGAPVTTALARAQEGIDPADATAYAAAAGFVCVGAGHTRIGFEP